MKTNACVVLCVHSGKEWVDVKEVVCISQTDSHK